LLYIGQVVDDGGTLEATDYLGYPRNKWWENGPYTRLRIDPAASSISVWTMEDDIVVITGRWGLYDENVSTGATVQNDPLTAGGTSLLVDDGSVIRVGAVLLIGSEQVLVLATGAETDATTNTAEELDNSEEGITVGDGSLFTAGEIIKIDNEKMLVLDVSSNVLVVARGWARTSRETHSTATDVYVYRTFTVKRGVNGTTAVEHLKDVAISKYIAPWEVKYLCQQMASIMSKKDDSSYAGKTGNVDLGEVFYHDEFPKTVLMNINKEYKRARRHGA
jgi:hypothetical protein